MNQGKRLDGRGFEDVRPILREVGILPRAHGSAFFNRGETQAVTLVTLGTSEDAQEFDSYTGGDSEKKFILHYNFPNFLGRRNRPHQRAGPAGNRPRRAGRALRSNRWCRWPPIPTPSASPARSWSPTAPLPWPPSAAATLALMDAGVPMTRPVGGISIGICTEHDDQDTDLRATSS